MKKWIIVNKDKIAIYIHEGDLETISFNDDIAVTESGWIGTYQTDVIVGMKWNSEINKFE